MSTTLVILASSIVLFLTGVLPSDLVALLAAVALGMSGLLTPQEALSGFSRQSTITVIAICVLAEALERAGLTSKVSGLLLRVARSSERGSIAAVAGAGAFLSLSMNNIAAASLLLPIVGEVARRSGVSISRLAMPLAFGTLLGGMATLFTSTNLVVSATLRESGLHGFGVFDFLPIGGPAAIVGIAFLALVGPRLLPAVSPIERERDARLDEVDLVQAYRLGHSLRKFEVSRLSPLIGARLDKSPLWSREGVRVAAIQGVRGSVYRAVGAEIVAQGDILVLQGIYEKVLAVARDAGLEEVPVAEWHSTDLMPEGEGVFEVVLSPRSGLLGKSLLESRFREKYGFSVLAIWRGAEQLVTGFSDTPLLFGDALLIQGPRSRRGILSSDPDFIVLGDGGAAAPLSRRGRVAAIVISILTLLWAAFDQERAAEVLLLGALATVLCKVMTMEDVYRAVEWRTVFLLAGMLPMGTAVTKTQLGQEFGSLLLTHLGTFGPIVLLVTLMLFAALLTQIMTGAAVAAILAPVAIQTAQAAHIDPRALAMGVTMGTSMAFMTPIGHPVNTLVAASAGYKVSDFIRLGVPLLVLVAAVIAIVIPLTFSM